MNDELGKAIKAARKNKNLTQKQLGELIGKAESTIRKYENGSIEVPSSVLEQIGRVLNYFFFKFTFDEESKNIEETKDSTYFLEQKLKQIGYSFDGDPAEGYLWINYPDGTLEISESDLEDLDQSSNSFLKFKLEELKQKHIKDFRPKK